MTKIGFPETRLGIIPGAGGTQLAARLLGLSKTKDLIYTARTLTALEALEWGDSIFFDVNCIELTLMQGLVDYV